MLYLYKYDSPRTDKILIRELGGLVTEQQYYKDGILVDKETFAWKVFNKRLEGCYGNKGGIIIVPPTLGPDYDIQCIATDAFINVEPSLVVVMPQGRVSLEKNAFRGVGEAKVHSWLKRSEIPYNVKALGRIVEDVRS